MENKGRLKSPLERLVLVQNLANHWQLDSRARHYVCRICVQKPKRIEVIAIKTVHVKARLNSFENLVAFWPQLITPCNACCRYMFVYRVYCAFAMACLPAKRTTKQTRIATTKLNPGKISV